MSSVPSWLIEFVPAAGGLLACVGGLIAFRTLKAQSEAIAASRAAVSDAISATNEWQKLLKNQEALAAKIYDPHVVIGGAARNIQLINPADTAISKALAEVLKAQMAQKSRSSAE